MIVPISAGVHPRVARAHSRRMPRTIPMRRRRGVGAFCMDDQGDMVDCGDTSSTGVPWTGNPTVFTNPLPTIPIFSTPGSTPPSSAGGGTDWTSVLSKVLPGAFTTLQEAIAQPGQVIRGPNGQIITGANPAGAPFSLLSGGLGAGSGTIWLLGGGLLLAVFLFSKK